MFYLDFSQFNLIILILGCSWPQAGLLLAGSNIFPLKSRIESDSNVFKTDITNPYMFEI